MPAEAVTAGGQKTLFCENVTIGHKNGDFLPNYAQGSIDTPIFLHYNGKLPRTCGSRGNFLLLKGVLPNERPACLQLLRRPFYAPLSALERAGSEITNYRGTGMSVMEMSHRSKAFVQIFEETQAKLRRLMNVPEGYKILFLQTAPPASSPWYL